MKKLILFTFAMLLCIPVFSKQKIRIEKVEPDSTTEEIVAYRTKSNHLSLSAHIGIGMLDGDQKQDYSVIFPRSAKQLNFGINLEYSFNPIWGIYLEYLHNPYGGKARYLNERPPHKGEDDPTIYNFRGINHEGVVGVSLNMLNLFSKCRKQVFNWYVNVGAGVSFFKITEHDRFPDLSDKNYKLSDYEWLPTWKKGEGRNGRSMSIPVGTTLEVNATRWLAILLSMQYRMHFQDFYDGAITGNQNDNTAYAGLGLRWKINNLTHRDRDHVRNMAMCQWEPDKLGKDNAKRIDSLKLRVDSIDVRVKRLEVKVNGLEKDMDKLRDTDGDGVPDIYDREPNTPPNTPVNQYGQAIGEPGSGRGVYNDGTYVRNNTGYSGGSGYPFGGSGTVYSGSGSGYSGGGSVYNGPVNENPIYRSSNVIMDEEGLSIYFATGRFDISAVSHNVLSAIARKLQAHPEYLVEIHAYCDEQGVKSNYANQKLSDNRAKKTRDTLVSKYGIDASRIVEVRGHGVIEGAPTIDYLPNRRADIIFVR